MVQCLKIQNSQQSSKKIKNKEGVLGYLVTNFSPNSVTFLVITKICDGKFCKVVIGNYLLCRKYLQHYKYL